MFLAGFKRPRISVGACDSTECRWLTDDAERSSKSGDLLGCRNFRLFSLGLSSLGEDASQVTKQYDDPSTSAFASSFLSRSQRDPIYRSCKRSRLRPCYPCFHRIPVHPLLAQSLAARVLVHLFRDQAARTVESRQYKWLIWNYCV